jgi:hypothetical protein
MKRLLSQALVVGAVAMGAGALTPACADNDQSIFIRDVLAPPSNRQNGTCVYTPDPTATMISEGVLDVGLSQVYNVMLIVGSQMIQRGDSINTRAESNRVHINGATVKVTDANGSKTYGDFSTLGSGFLDTQLNNIPGWGLAGVSAIDAPTGAKIAAELTAFGPEKQVVANIKLFGKTLGGVDLESGEFQFPIKVCKGCLIDFSTGQDPTVQGRNCALPPAAAGTSAAAAPPCQVGQDEPVSCQSCVKTNPLCAGQGP